MSYEVKLSEGGFWHPAKRLRTTKKMIYFAVYVEGLAGPPQEIRKRYDSEGKWWREVIDAPEADPNERPAHPKQCPNCSKYNGRGALITWDKDADLARTGVRIRFGQCRHDDRQLFGIDDGDCPDYFLDPRGRVQTQPGPENYRETPEDNLVLF